MKYICTVLEMIFYFILELFTGSPTELNSFSMEAGAHVIVGNKSVYPNQFDGINISPIQ
jgi:hypothetical protein